VRWDRPLAAIAAAAFLLTTAAMVRWYVAPQATRLPLDPDLTVTLTGTGTAWDPGRGRAVTGELREEIRIRGDRASGSAAVAVWRVERRLTRADGTVVRLGTERVALDRRTAAAVTCCGEEPRHSGLSYAFPPGTDRSARELFDPATGAAAAVRYGGQDQVAGRTTYRMEQVAGPVRRTGRPPGAAPPGLRATPSTVTVTSRRTLWVEPASGVILRVSERRTERAVTAGEPVTLLDATLTSDADSTRRLAEVAGDRAGRLTALRTTLPLGCLLAALVLVAVQVGHNAVTAGRRRREDVSRSSDTRW
jgi:hypothetical protein